MAKVAGDDPVPFWRLFLRMGGWLPLVLALALALLTVISAHQLGLAERFDTEGRAATAEVRRKYFTESTDSDGDRTVTYYLDLAFVTDAGEKIEIERSVNSGIYRAAQEGGMVPLWYLASEPERTELTRGSHRSGSRIAQIAGLVVGLLMLGSGWYAGRWAVAAVRARTYGARETAKVTGLKRTGYKVNNKPRYRLTWQEADGREGESLIYRRSHLDGIQRGSEIEVYQGLKRAWWSGDVGHRRDP